MTKDDLIGLILESIPILAAVAILIGIAICSN